MPNESRPPVSASPPNAVASPPLDRVILVYDGDSGLAAMLLDVVKKTAGREECALCEITNSPLGKRSAWRQCEVRLGLIVDELHRNQLPADWGISRGSLPCVLGRRREELPVVLITRDEISACRGSVELLESRLRSALSAHARAR